MSGKFAIPLLFFLLILSVFLAVTVGVAPLSLEDVCQVIFHKLLGTGSTEFTTGPLHDIVWFVRLPRIMLAVAVGMGLAVAGCVMQAIVQNPLADPYILGVSAGASLGATTSAMLGAGTFLGGNAIGVSAFFGALSVAWLVQLVANIGGRANAIRLLLAGMAFNAVCGAFSNFIIYMAPDKEGIGTITFWLMGSLAGAKWEQLLAIVPIIFLFTLLFISHSRILNMMLLGDETATTLGVNLTRFRNLYLILSSLMVGFAVYAAGMIGFVGFIIPHAVRLVVGADHKLLLPLSALAGSILLIWADVLCRVIVPEGELPIGVLISLIGAPAFIYLLVKRTYGFGG